MKTITIKVEIESYNGDTRYIATSPQLPGFLAETFSFHELQKIAPEMIAEHFLIEEVPEYKKSLINRAKDIKRENYMSLLKGLSISYIIRDAFAYA